MNPFLNKSIILFLSIILIISFTALVMEVTGVPTILSKYIDISVK